MIQKPYVLFYKCLGPGNLQNDLWASIVFCIELVIPKQVHSLKFEVFKYCVQNGVTLNKSVSFLENNLINIKNVE